MTEEQINKISVLLGHLEDRIQMAADTSKEITVIKRRLIQDCDAMNAVLKANIKLVKNTLSKLEEALKEIGIESK